MKKMVAIFLVIFCLCSFVSCKEESLKIDFSTNLCAENAEYVKGIDQNVGITIIGSQKEDRYLEYLNYYATSYFGIASPSTDEELETLNKYFCFTRDVIADYNKCNDKITVSYVDPQELEFNTYIQKYPDYEFVYGDIVVEATVNGNVRTKILTFNDVYALSEGTVSYYATTYAIAGNKIESALSSAIAYVTSTENKKVAIISGHSTKPYTSAYVDILTANNYEVIDVSSKTITNISNEYDVIAISAPTIDFQAEELNAIAEFLDNNGKLGKGLIFFADAASPYLPNLYGFLEQWGITTEEGIIFETDTSNAYANIKTTIGTFPVALEDDKITENIGLGAITDYNVPMKVCNPTTTARKATALMQTKDTTVIAPVGINAEWTPGDKDLKQQFDTVIQSVETGRDKDGNTITSYVMAFASVEYIQSAWADYNELCNQNIVMAVSDRAAHIKDTTMTFTVKTIE